MGAVDPLAADYAAWTPYHYVHNNPISLIDPTGMSADTVRFNTVAEDGSKSTFAQINTYGDNVDFDIPFDHVKHLGLDVTKPLLFDQELFKSRSDVDAVSIDFSGEYGKGLGVQGSISFIGMIDGLDIGEWAVAIQGNLIAGYEAGFTVTTSAYKPVSKPDLLLRDLKGWEFGIQGGWSLPGSGLGAATSYFTGRDGFLGQDIYRGMSSGTSKGFLKGPISGSAYVGFTRFFDSSKKRRIGP